VHQDAEVPQLLRYLVGGLGQPGGDPDADVDQEGAADGQASQQVVEAVGDEDQEAEGFVLGDGAVAVMPTITAGARTGGIVLSEKAARDLGCAQARRSSCAIRAAWARWRSAW